MIDALIILFIIFAVYRGREIGFVRQACSTVGFVGGLFIGAWLQPHVMSATMSQSERSLMALFTTLGCALALMTVGEYIGVIIKHKTKPRSINVYDNALGIVLASASILFSFWLLAAVLSGLPFTKLNSAIERSNIVKALNHVLPDAPTFVNNIAHLIDPNGFPQVFIGSEPTPPSNVNLPALGEMRPAVEKTQASVVKIEGEGCGGIVDGSGFIVGNGYIATNAHVVAGIKRPFVSDSQGAHRGTVVWFDPNIDFAVVKVSGLSGQPLEFVPNDMPKGTPAAVLGYPNGGGFNAGLAAILDQFIASGRNIYDRGDTKRDVYEIKAKVVPGNSGGPLISKDGKVLGVVFAESTEYEGVGYALTSTQVREAVQKAVTRSSAVGTGQCASE